MIQFQTIRKPIRCLSSIIVVFGASYGFADVDTQNYSWIPYTDYGYVGANIGRSDYKSGSCAPHYSCDDSDLGYKIYTGGQISRIIGIEVGYVNIGDFDRNGGHKRGQGADVHLVGNIPLGKSANIYAKAGGVYGWTSTSASAPGEDTGHEREFNWSYGAGLQFELAKQWALRADWDQYRMKFADRRDNIALYSLGAIYKF
jgi:opacity protein-like surface antigen